MLITDGKKFSSNGLQIQCPLDYTNKQRTWSECVIEAIGHIDTEYILFMLDDFWIKEPVDDILIDKCIGYLDSDKNAGTFCLRHQPDFKLHEESKFSEFVRRPKSEPYRITTQVSVWRKSYLNKILRKHESVWDFETFAKYRSRLFYPERIYLIKPTVKMPIVYHSGGVLYRGKYVMPYLKEFKNDLLGIDLSRGYYLNKPSNYDGLITPKYDFWSITKSLFPKY